MEAQCSLLEGHDNSKPHQPRKNTKFKSVQTAMVKNHACHMFDPKYPMDWK